MIKIVCGLGNPGRRYRHTRHNLGFEVVDRLAEQDRAKQFERDPLFEYLPTALEGESVWLVKPLTYMNNSGEAVAAALEKFELSVAQLFVIVDDFNLEFGHLRIRKKGSSGGHRGLESMIEALGGNDFSRLRLGIGPLPETSADRLNRNEKDGEDERGTRDDQIANFVLSRFRPDEESIVPKLISLASQAATMVVKAGVDAAINRYNNINPTPEN